MKQITAYQDDAGRLHKARIDAIEADFVYKIQRAWGSMPDLRDRGDPVVIARTLASSTYPTVRKQIADAIAWFEHQLISAEVDARTHDDVSAAGESK